MTKRQWAPEKFYVMMLVVPIVFFSIFFMWPIIQVVFRSFLEPSFGIGNYAKVFGEATFRYIFFMTFVIAAVVTLFCLLLAYPLAYYISRQQGWVFALTMGVVLVPMWTSVIIRSYAWMILFQRNGAINQILMEVNFIDNPVRILQTWTAVVVGMVHILLPFMVLPLINNMRSIDQTMLRAGRVLGAPPLTLFFRVYVPLTSAGAKAGISLVFIMALGFYVTPALLGGARGTMIAVLIEEQASTFLDWPLASALSTVLLAATISVYAIYIGVTGRRERKLV